MDRRTDYRYHLPAEQIAQVPPERRDGSRLLHVPTGGDGEDAPLSDRRFADIVELVPADAVLVVNDTRVFPARLRTRKPTGGVVEFLFIERLEDPGLDLAAVGESGRQAWRCLARASKKLRAGTTLEILDRGGQPVGASVTLATDRAADTTVVVSLAGDAFALLQQYGQVPLPPYIERPAGASAADAERYQTVYARERGAVAAPTAGLHFTDAILDALRHRGVDIVPVTLHVGLGTFAPMRADQLNDHQMHSERYTIPEATAAAIERARAGRRPVVAVGTTCVRALESAAARAPDGQTVASGPASTDLFIRPGYRYRVVDQLITNFHLPESTLLMLVCAFAGYERTMAAYAHAVADGYRFFSYGDAMLVSRAPMM